MAESVASTVKPPKEVPQQPKRSGQFFTAKQLAERWHLHPVSVLRMLRCGTLPCVWVGRRKLVPVSVRLRNTNRAIPNGRLVEAM